MVDFFVQNDFFMDFIYFWRAMQVQDYLFWIIMYNICIDGADKGSVKAICKVVHLSSFLWREWFSIVNTVFEVSSRIVTWANNKCPEIATSKSPWNL